MHNSLFIATIARDILENNDFSNVLNALSINDLYSLQFSDNTICLNANQEAELFSILHDMCINKISDIAVDMFVNNSYLSTINALANKCLDSLYIKDTTNSQIYKILNDIEKERLCKKLDSMCEKKVNFH